MADVTLAAVVLAAGASERLGHPKQALEGPGGPLLAATIAAARAAGAAPIVVTIGAHADTVRPLAAGSVIVEVPAWRDGQHASLSAGLAALADAPAAIDGAFLLVCDQPLLAADVLVALHDAFRRTGADAAAAAYDGILGTPAIVARRHWSRLTAAGPSGDARGGARALLRDPALRVAQLEWPEGGFDVDTPADEARLRAVTTATSPPDGA